MSSIRTDNIRLLIDQHTWKATFLKSRRTALSIEIEQHESCKRTLEQALEDALVGEQNPQGLFAPGLAVVDD